MLALQAQRDPLLHYVAFAYYQAFINDADPPHECANFYRKTGNCSNLNRCISQLPALDLGFSWLAGV